MKILLLGGTGVMGSYLSKKYESNGIDTFITTRSDRASNGFIHYIKGNAMDMNFLHKICNLYHWDAIVDFMSYKTSQFQDRVALLLDSTNQYVYISTGRVYAHEESPIKETSPRLLDCCTDQEYLSTDEYALTKARQEDILKKSEKKNYTIIRPCIIYGDERLQFGVLEKEEWLFRALHGREIVFCQEILDRYTTMTSGEDIARAFFNIIGNSKCLGETYHLTCNHHRTWGQIFDTYKTTIKELTGKNLKIKIVSLNEFINSRPSFLKYQVIYDRIYDKIYDIAKESTIIDVDTFLTPEVGLRKSVTNFLSSNQKFSYIPIEYEARRDRLTCNFSSVYDIPGLKRKVKYLYFRIFK